MKKKRTIISIAEESINDFLLLIKKEIQNLDKHPLYPCSIIDIIRNYIKAQAKNASKHLPLFIEIILKTLDPNNTQFRKINHVPVTNALQAIFKIFANTSFN